MKYKKLILFSLCLTIFFLSIGVSAASNTTDNQNIEQNNTITHQVTSDITNTQQIDTKKEVTSNKSLKTSSTLISTKTKAVYGNTYTSGTKINVKVTSNDNSIPYGTVKVFYNNKAYQARLLSSGKATFNVVGLPAGSRQIVVKYMGSSKYQSSNMTSVKKITLIPTKTTVTYSNTYTSGTKINVKVTSNDNSIPYGTVKVFYNNKAYQARLLSSGKATFNVVGLPAGSRQIVVKYMGSSKYQSSNMTSTKKITLTPTKITAIYGNTYTTQTTIYVKVIGKDYTKPNGNVGVYSNGKLYAMQQLDYNGETTFNIKGLRTGTRQITVKYIGSSKYQTINTTSTKKITLIPTTITTEYDSTKTQIKVQVTSDDYTTPNGNVKVICNGKAYKTQLLNSYGKATFNITKIPSGWQYITIKYIGSSKYQSSLSEDYIYIPKESTTTKMYVKSKTVRDTSIQASVYDSEGNYVKSGSISVLVDGSEVAKYTLINGKKEFNLDLYSGEKNITIKYLSNDKYKASQISNEVYIKDDSIVHSGKTVTIYWCRDDGSQIYKNDGTPVYTWIKDNGIEQELEVSFTKGYSTYYSYSLYNGVLYQVHGTYNSYYNREDSYLGIYNAKSIIYYKDGSTYGHTDFTNNQFCGDGQFSFRNLKDNQIPYKITFIYSYEYEFE